MPSCAVPNCKSGYKSNPQSFHFFTVPKNRVDEWKKAIGCEKLVAGRSICEKHFLPDEYVWQRELRAPDGTIVGVSPYAVPRLKPGVIPSVFPWPNGKTPADASDVDWKEWNAPKKIVSESDSQKNGAVSEMQSLDQGLGQESLSSLVPSLPRSPASSPLPPLTSTPAPATTSPTSPATAFPPSDKSNLATEECELTAIFQKLIETDFDISSPWVKGISKDLAGRNVIHFSLMKMAKITEMVTPVIVEKSIVVNPDLTTQIYVMNEPLNKTIFSIPSQPITTVSQLQDLIHSIDSFKICSGSRFQNDLHQATSTIVHRDVTGIWRHNKCTLLVDSDNRSTICAFCNCIKKAH